MDGWQNFRNSPCTGHRVQVPLGSHTNVGVVTVVGSGVVVVVVGRGGRGGATSVVVDDDDLGVVFTWNFSSNICCGSMSVFD